VSGTVSAILAIFSHFVDEFLAVVRQAQIKDRQFFVAQRLFLGYDLPLWDD
jgi:hypothetical protein